MSDRYWKLGIIGWPLGYSLSPLMHQAALKVVGLQGEYREYPVDPEGLWDWLSHSQGLGLDGFNVTMPYKKSVFSWVIGEGSGKLGHLEELSGVIGAINTVVFREGHPFGYNTDGEGFLKSLTEPPRSVSLAGWKVNLLGSGGSAQAIAAVLALKTKISSLTIWNRKGNLARAQEISAKVNHLRRSKTFAQGTSDLHSLSLEDGHLLINATPTGMKEREELPLDYDRLHEGQVVYDIVYEPRETKLIREARKRGCTVITGDEMLAGQGAAAFEIWTGVPAGKVLPAMKKGLDEHFAARS